MDTGGIVDFAILNSLGKQKIVLDSRVWDGQ